MMLSRRHEAFDDESPESSQNGVFVSVRTVAGDHEGD